MKRAAIYARYRSDESQKHAQHGLLRQIRICRHYARTEGFEVLPNHIYTDTTSANAASRPGFDKLRQAVREKQVDVVVVSCFDRLFRNSLRFMNFMSELDSLNIVLVSAQGPSLERIKSDLEISNVFSLSDLIRRTSS